MNLLGEIDTIYNGKYDRIILKDLNPGMSTLADIGAFGRANAKLITNIFFVHITSDHKLLEQFTLKWRKKNIDGFQKISVLTIYSDDIKFGHYDFTRKTIPLKKYLQLGMCGEEAKIIKREFVTSQVCHFFSESGYFVVNNVLLHRPHDWLLKHTKYLNRLTPRASKIESYFLGHYLV